MSTSSNPSCSDNVCSICLDTCSVVSYADGCLHRFCGRCIFEWAQRSQLCPICRTFFANIITNVTSDTEYEVIPLEDRRIPVSNYIRDSWWANHGYPSNRNIFAVRQRSNQHQHHHQHQQQSEQQEPRLPQQQPMIPSTEQPSASNEPLQVTNQSTRQPIEEMTSNLQIQESDRSSCNPRPRRVVWSSNRFSNRQFIRQQPTQSATVSHHENVAAFRQIISPAYRTDYHHNRGGNNQINIANNPRQVSSPRPFRPLVGVRQETQCNQNQQHNQQSSQPSHNFNVNCQPFYPRSHQFHPQSLNQSHNQAHHQSHHRPHHQQHHQQHHHQQHHQPQNQPQNQSQNQSQNQPQNQPHHQPHHQPRQQQRYQFRSNQFNQYHSHHHHHSHPRPSPNPAHNPNQQPPAFKRLWRTDERPSRR